MRKEVNASKDDMRNLWGALSKTGRRLEEEFIRVWGDVNSTREDVQRLTQVTANNTKKVTLMILIM